MPNNDFHHGVSSLKPWLDHPIRVSPEEARRLKAAADAGDEQARAALIQACLPYALKLARQFHQRTGFDLDECISVACCGCVECVRHFDPDRGAILTFVHCRMRSLLPEARRRVLRGPQPAPHEFDFDALIDDREARETIAEQVREAVALLPTRLRKIAEQHYLDGLNFAEIGRRMGVTRERVRQLAGRVERALRTELERRLDV